MLSKHELFSIMLTKCDQEGFMLAYHVWMDERTKMIGAQVTALFLKHSSHIVCVMIGLRI